MKHEGFNVIARAIPEGDELESKYYEFTWVGDIPSDYMLPIWGSMFQIVSVQKDGQELSRPGLVTREKVLQKCGLPRPLGTLYSQSWREAQSTPAISDLAKTKAVIDSALTSAGKTEGEKQWSARELLQTGLVVLKQRAETRDASQGERSMAKAVAIFNAWTGNTLSEEDGWRFMISLKQAREIQGKFHADDYVDGANYFALLGECESMRGPR
jgi:hypothetical protein